MPDELISDEAVSDEQVSSPEDHSTRQPRELSGDLSITALYTAHTWAWAKFAGADRFASDQTRGVFNVTNGALALMRLFRWGLPRLPEGLAQRHALIDALTSHVTPDVVIELASGLSSRSLRLSESLALTAYHEVDLPHVIAHKRAHSHEPLPSIHLHALDLHTLERAHIQAWIGERERPVMIAEGIMMYLDAPESERLLGVIASALRERGGRLIFDWVPTVEQPRPGLIGRALGALMRLFTGGQSFERDECTRVERRDTLRALGATVRVLETTQVAQTYDLPFPNAHTQQLIFCADWSPSEQPKLNISS